MVYYFSILIIILHWDFRWDSAWRADVCLLSRRVERQFKESVAIKRGEVREKEKEGKDRGREGAEK